ncbi:MAG TPA: PilZ domain-containing protein [Polyangia bacterium]|nr:PilZ domain-containing protein [Polyangia bacterium]
MRTEATTSSTRANRRRHQRVQLGLPVEVHVDDVAETLTVELIDIAAGGVRLRPLTSSGITVDRRATFGFIVPGGGKCVAGGRVARVQPGGEFVVVLDRANPAFREFLRSLAA